MNHGCDNASITRPRSPPRLLQAACDEAVEFLSRADDRPVNRQLPPASVVSLPAHGVGAQRALALFTQAYSEGLTASAGPRYFGFVTGGSTPAAIMGDWLTSAYDQNASDRTSRAAAQIEESAVGMVRASSACLPCSAAAS